MGDENRWQIELLQRFGVYTFFREIGKGSELYPIAVIMHSVPCSALIAVRVLWRFIHKTSWHHNTFWFQYSFSQSILYCLRFLSEWDHRYHISGQAIIPTTISPLRTRKLILNSESLHVSFCGPVNRVSVISPCSLGLHFAHLFFRAFEFPSGLSIFSFMCTVPASIYAFPTLHFESMVWLRGVSQHKRWMLHETVSYPKPEWSNATWANIVSLCSPNSLLYRLNVLSQDAT